MNDVELSVAPFSGISTDIEISVSGDGANNLTLRTTPVVQIATAQIYLGLKGDAGKDGQGIDNYVGDPLAFYILAKS